MHLVAQEQDLHLAYDRDDSTEFDAKYYVWDMLDNNAVVYKGSYTQCLVFIGGVNLGYTVAEIKDKSNGFI